MQSIRTFITPRDVSELAAQLARNRAQQQLAEQIEILEDQEAVNSLRLESNIYVNAIKYLHLT